MNIINSYLGALDVHTIKTGAQGAHIQITQYSRCVYSRYKVQKKAILYFINITVTVIIIKGIYVKSPNRTISIRNH